MKQHLKKCSFRDNIYFLTEHSVMKLENLSQVKCFCQRAGPFGIRLEKY